MSGMSLPESGLQTWSKKMHTRRYKTMCIYGQRRAYMTIRRCQVFEDGEIKTKYYRRLSFHY